MIFVNKIKEYSLKFFKANYSLLISSGIPKVIIEFVSFIILAFIINKFVNDENNIVSILFLSFFKLVPSLNKMIFYRNSLPFYEKSLINIIKLLRSLSNDCIHHSTENAQSNKVIVQNLSKNYNSKQLFYDITFSAPEGSYIQIVGASGCGKSTLLKILFGACRQDEGLVNFHSVKYDSFSEVSSNSLCFVEQTTPLFEGTLFELICIETKNLINIIEF